MVVRGRDAALPFRTVFRWLAWPTIFVISMWLMLFHPESARSWLPKLWTTGGKGLDEVLPPQPKTRVQTFDLGGHARYYADHCYDTDSKGGRGKLAEEQCEATLRQAAEVVGVLGSCAPERCAAAACSGDAGVMGFFGLVSIMWLVAVSGIILTVGPCVAYLLGPLLLRCAAALVIRVLAPLATFLHEHGFIEALAYLSSVAMVAQGLRYPPAQAQAGMMVSLTGGLFLIPCWGYSTALHVKQPGGDLNKFVMLSNALVAGVLAPLAILHDSRLVGFLAVLALYGAMGFMFSAFGFGFLIGFDGKAGLQHCLASSVLLVGLFLALRVSGVSPAWLRPFGTGAMCLGNIMYFLAILILSSDRRCNYKRTNGLMLGSLLAAMFVGSVWALPSMSNTACVFFVLWVMTKQIEVKWGGCEVVVLFANFVVLYFMAHYLHTHPKLVTSMFDPEGLFPA